MHDLLAKAAGKLARSVIFSRARLLFVQNQQNFNLPLGKWDKLTIGLYLVLSDYGEGKFPPKYLDEDAAYAAEKQYRRALGGCSQQAIAEAELRKPFWFGRSARKYLGDFIRVIANLERLGLKPPARVLELGCGAGWMSELLATTGLEVVGATLSEVDVADARKRIGSLDAKGLRSSLSFEVAPMESVAETLGRRGYFDAVIVYEALHHVHDWKRSLASARECLRPGGWLLICSEPNRIHLFSSYRVARLSNTHEVGFSHKDLVAGLREVGFVRVERLGTWLHLGIRPHWLAAQK